MGNLIQDLKYGIRMLVKNPGFTAVAVIALALGIGANSSIFSVVNAVLLNPLPFKDPNRLVIINETVQRETLETRPASYPDFVDWRDQNQVFEQIAAIDGPSFSLTGGDEPERVNGEQVSADYFPLLGVNASLGRTFLKEEDTTPDANPVAVLSNDLWKRRFGSEKNLVGKTIKLNDKDFTVVGIMPEGFKGLTGEAEIWIPMMMISTNSSPRILANRGTRWLSVIGRLKPGVTIERAQAEMNTIAVRLEQTYQQTNKDRGVQIVSAREATVGDIRPTILVLLGTVGFVLLIACANVANLQLARATARQKEVAIRTALGASRIRLIRQFLTESVILSLAGGIFGLLLAVWGVDLITAFIGNQIPNFIKIRIDERVLFFTFFISILTGIVFGLAPALHASKPGLNEMLKEGGKGTGAGAQRSRLRKIFVITEVALALILLIGAGLMLKSFQRLQAFDPGFKSDHIITAKFSLPQSKTVPEVLAFSRQLLESTKGQPSVQSVAIASEVPLDGNSNASIISIETTPIPEKEIRVYTHKVSPGFFSTMGIPILKGREFTDQDNDNAPRIVIVSDFMASRYWPGDDPIGKRISLGRDKDGKPNWYQVAGVVDNVKYRTLIRDQNQDPDIYFSLFQEPTRSLTIAARTTVEPENVAPAIKAQVLGLNPNLPLYGVQTMEKLMGNQTARSRLTASLISIFAMMAMLLAIVGIYGVMSYSASQRTHEVGIRMALGAQKRDILKLVIKDGMILILAGLGIGLVGALFTTRLLTSQLYNVSATDMTTYLAVPLLLATVALIACYIPARRATKVDPMVALRYE